MLSLLLLSQGLGLLLILRALLVQLRPDRGESRLQRDGRLPLLSGRPRGRGHGAPLQPEDVGKVHDRVVGVGDAGLSTLAHPHEREVGQLSTERGEGGVVEVDG